MKDITLVTKRIGRVLYRYEDIAKIKYIVLSKKLYRYLGHPKEVLGLEVIEDGRLYALSYVFTLSKEYDLPPRAHSIEFKDVTNLALKVTRIVKCLTDEVNYRTEIPGGTTMPEIAFVISNIIKEMNEAGYCKTEDMLKNINNYLKG